MMTTPIHVQINLDGRWIARREGCLRPSKRAFRDRVAAVRWAIKQESEVVIHRKDGTVDRLIPNTTRTSKRSRSS